MHITSQSAPLVEIKSRFIAMVSILIARRWVGPETENHHDLQLSSVGCCLMFVFGPSPVSQLEFFFSADCLNRNCLVQFCGIPWYHTLDVHRGYSLITWLGRYITWRWRHINHGNTIRSVIAAKRTVITEVYVCVFSIKHRYSDILLENT